MRRKFLVIFCILISSSICLAQEYSDAFVKAFGSCSNYSDAGSFKTENMDVTSSKKISGYKNNKCMYEENIKMGETKAKVLCEFSKEQVNEITEVMKAYSLVQKYTDEKVDTSSLENVQNNPVVKVWSKYIQDVNVCQINFN